MKKLLVVFVLIFLIFPGFLLSQTGKIAGKVTYKETGKPLQGVAVFLEDSKTGTYTLANGTFILRDVSVGPHTVSASFIGYEMQSKEIVVEADITKIIDFEMIRSAIGLEGITVSANRAVKRETPIAFTDINEEIISDKYTTQDMPQLLEDVPGLFANTTGIGDAQITMRGFEADKIQVLINGIPVNDPESQKVYWSNWTGLSSSVKSVQVQKGAGSSLYGSGAFGGSLNIETIGTSTGREFSVRSSIGGYKTEGDVADGKGGMEDYNPYNYNLVMRYCSGNLYEGKFSYDLMVERKAGDYYIAGTNYDGYSFGIDTQNVFGKHKLNFSFIGAPQEHNQVYFKSDRNLIKTLGREYSRNNHEYQENYYFKPQISVREEWSISDKQVLMTNIFVTKGDGGGKYLSQDKFDINTGEIHYRDGFLDEAEGYEDNQFGLYARYLYEEYGATMEGYVPSDSNWFGYPSYKGNLVAGAGQDFFISRYNYSWRNNSISDHFQVGGNTYYQHDISQMLNLVIGGEIRSWKADHIRKRENFRHYNPDFPDGVETYDRIQNQYDETSYVLNMSCFARTQIKFKRFDFLPEWFPMQNMNIMIDGQLASYNSKVEENPIQIYDLGNGEPMPFYFYSTKNITVTDTAGVVTKKFTKDDYKKTYEFFSPKFGINYNLSEYFNFMTNYSISYKEPRTMEWYSGYDGPDGNQMYTISLVDSNNQAYEVEKFYGELDPEKINTMEFGVGYDGVYFDINANYYISDYVDKIEQVDVPVTNYYYDAQGDSVYSIERDVPLTLNAGEARHQGLELSSNAKYQNIDAAFNLTLSTNRWTKMNVDDIFGGDADDMKGKVVPFSPEKMINGSLGYTFQNLPLNGKLRIGFSVQYWDDYYASYTNEYYNNYIWDGVEAYIADTLSIKESKLPAFIELGSSIKYAFKIAGKDAFIRLDMKNIMNKKDNYSSANVKSDYNRGYFNEQGEFLDDYLTGNPYMYVTPAPLFNMFITMEVKF